MPSQPQPELLWLASADVAEVPTTAQKDRTIAVKV
jgi:hypothetical protein